MAYNPELPNSYDQGLIPEDVRNDYFEEYLSLTPIQSFMGESEYSSIQLFEIAKGGGKVIHIPLRRELDHTKFIKGYAKLSGAEQRPVFYEDKFGIDIKRLPVGVDSTKWTAQITPVKVFESMRPLLLNASKKDLVESVLATACGTPVQGGTYDPAASIPSYDRALFAGLAPARGDWYGNINTGVAAMNTGIEYNENGLSVDFIRKLKTYCVNGGADDIVDPEAVIPPAKALKDYMNFPEEYYFLLCDTGSIVSLNHDPQWKDYAYRGVIESSDQPSFIKGGRYRGMVEGVMVFECKELNKFRKISGGFTAAHNIMMGGQAFAVGWGHDRTWFKMEERDFGNDVAMAICEMRGEHLIRFPSFIDQNNTVERGLIHAFTRIR